MCGKDGGLAFICALLVGARQGGAQRLERQFGEGGVGGIGEFVADFLEGEAVVGRFLQDIVDMFCKVAGAGCAGRCLCAQGGEGLCGGRGRGAGWVGWAGSVGRVVLSCGALRFVLARCVVAFVFALIVAFVVALFAACVVVLA